MESLIESRIIDLENDADELLELLVDLRDLETELELLDDRVGNAISYLDDVERMINIRRESFAQRLEEYQSQERQ